MSIENQLLIIERPDIVNIANAIREKTGKTNEFSLLDMPTEIRNIQGGGASINLDEEIDTQDDLIAQIQVMLEGKAAGGGKSDFESFLTDKIENNFVSVYEFVPGGRLEDTTPPPEPGTYYNYVKLPEIPTDAMASYPYAWIRKNTPTGYYDLILTASQPYFYQNAIAYGNDTTAPTAVCAKYRILISSAETATAWEYVETSDTWHSVDATRPVFWSNHDITNGPATTTATEIYFKGSEPVIVE